MIQKYRAWNIEVKEMYKFETYEDISELFLALGLDDSFYYVMQSSDLKDNTGETLFEGDIILWTYQDEWKDEGVAKIVFDKGMFKLLDINTDEEVWDSLYDCIENCNVYLQGNIYENPELLEGKSDEH